jgi:hypothetical protein
MFLSGRELAGQYISALDDIMPRVERLLAEQVVVSAVPQATDLELFRSTFEHRIKIPPPFLEEDMSAFSAWLIEAEALRGAIGATVF